jgi:hypothetical protein
MRDGLDDEDGVAVVDPRQGVVEADGIPAAMLAARRKMRRSPPLQGSSPTSRAVMAASQSMLAISSPLSPLPAMVMNRLVKSSRSSQQPEPMMRLVPASSEWMPLAQARRAFGSQPPGLETVMVLLS